MKIIAVDDESDAISNFILSIVDESDIDCKMFRSDPLQALEYITKNHVDAAFLDIHMPKINGVELAQRFIEVVPEIRIVFISGYAQDEKAIKEKLKDNLIGFCYKPYKTEQLYMLIKQIASGLGNSRHIFIKTFGAFDILIDNKPVKIKSAKAKELLALLVDRCGAHVGMNDAICFLWPDKSSELAKLLYRDAVWRLRQALNDYGLGSLVTFSRAQQSINKNGIKCDYWDFLDGRNKELYCDSYMPNYDWSIDTQSVLDAIKSKE